MNPPQANILETLAIASQHGLSVNQHDRVFRNGAAMSIEQNVAIAVQYSKAKRDAQGACPNISKVAKVCQVARLTILKVKEDFFLLDV